MRKSKNGTIEGGKSYEVKELTVEQILRTIDEFGSAGTDLEALKSQADKFLPWVVNLKIDELKEMAPSEIRQVYDDFMEVNDSFFALARGLGLDKVGSSLKEALAKDFIALFASSLNPATGQPGDMGGASSSSPLKKTTVPEESA
jgi:hypothetical protein